RDEIDLALRHHDADVPEAVLRDCELLWLLHRLLLRRERSERSGQEFASPVSLSDCLAHPTSRSGGKPALVRPQFAGLFEVIGRLRPRRPDLARALLALLLGRPDLLPCLGLLERDRLRVLYEDIDGLAHRDVLPERVVAPL